MWRVPKMIMGTPLIGIPKTTHDFKGLLKSCTQTNQLSLFYVEKLKDTMEDGKKKDQVVDPRGLSP